MTEATLTIQPKVYDSAAKAGYKKVRDHTRTFVDDQRKALRSAETRLRGLEGAWDGIGSSIRSAHGAMGRTFGMMTSMKAAVLGMAAGGAGKTFFDLTLGSNIEQERHLVTFRTLIGDAKKADALMKGIGKYAASTPFAGSDLIAGSKALLRLTGSNIEKNQELLKVAAQMAAINPSKTIGDAAEALLDAEMLEFERLKEFGIKLSKKDVQRSRKRGEKIGAAALRGVSDALKKQTGGRDVVGALSQTVFGKVSTAKDNFRAMMKKVGKPAFDELSKGLDEVNAEFGKLGTNPQFKKDLKDLAGITRTLVVEAVRLGKALPGAIKKGSDTARSALKFASDHSTALKVVGGAYVANKVTGGALARGALNLGSRFMRGKGGALGKAVGAATAMPVYVVNMGEGGFGGPAGTGAAAKFASTLWGTFKAKGVMGLLASGGTGALAVAGGGVIAGTTAGALATLAHVTNKTGKAMDGFRKKAEAAEKERSRVIRAQLKQRFAMPELGAKKLRKADIDSAMVDVGLGGMKRLAAAKSRLQGLYSLSARTGAGEEALAQINAGLARRGMRAKVGKGGKLSFSSHIDAGTEAKVTALKAFYAEQDRDVVMNNPAVRAQYEKDNAYVRSVNLLRRRGKESAAALNAAKTNNVQANISAADLRMMASVLGQEITRGLRAAGISPEQLAQRAQLRESQAEGFRNERSQFIDPVFAAAARSRGKP